MSYHPVRQSVSYHFPDVDFGGGSDVTFTIPCPVPPEQAPAAGGIVTSGQQGGRVRGVSILNVTEDFAGSNSDAGVQVGDGSDVDKYFDSGLVLDETVDVGEAVFLADDGSAVDIETGRSTITVTCVASDGTPTGIADVYVHVDWF